MQYQRCGSRVLLVSAVLAGVSLAYVSTALSQDDRWVDRLCERSPLSIRLPAVASIWTEIERTKQNLRLMNLDPGVFDWLSAQSEKWFGLNVLDASSLKKAGIELNHPWALVAHSTGPILVLGTTNTRQFAQTIANSLTSATGVKTKTKERSTPFGSLLTILLDGTPRLAIAAVNGAKQTTLVGAVESVEGILNDISNGPPPPAVADPALRFSFSIRFDEFAAMISEPELADGLERCDLGVYANGLRYDVRGGCSLKPMITNFTDLFVPVFKDPTRQTRFLSELPKDPVSVVRLLIPTDAVKQLMVNTGVWTPETRQEAADSLGFDIETDVLDVFLGDITWIVPSGLADLRLEMTVADAGRAEKFLRHVLEIDESPNNPTIQTTSKRVGDILVYDTQLVFPDEEDWISPRFYWSFRDGRLVVGLTERSVLQPAGESVGQFAQTFPDVAAKLENPSTFFVYQRTEDGASSLLSPVKLIRNQFAPDLRKLIAFVDVVALAMDQSLYGWAEISFRPGGVDLTGSGESVEIDPEQDDSSAAGAYAAALKEIYAGEIYSGKQKLLTIADRFPGSRQALRAQRALFSASSLYGYYQAISAAVTVPWLAALFTNQGSVFESVTETSTNIGDPCVLWAQNVCYYRGNKSKDCEKGRKLLKQQKPNTVRKKTELEKCALQLYQMRGY
ncbi:MAG: hypothetical protein HUU55_12485 [Myxococcales bacterium]|nr:hypothetical protein [Myxococcales bacterium]